MKINPLIIAGANADPTEWVQNGMKDTYRYEMYAASVKRIQTLLGMPEGGDNDSIA